MAVPTQQNHKTTSIEGMGVPVLFSIKNVQPLILAAKPTAGLNNQHSSELVSTAPMSSLPTTTGAVVATVVGTTASSTANSTADLQPKARRSGLLSKAIATGFVVMLIVVVIRFSVPQSNQSMDVAESVEGKQSETIEAVVTGPESNSNLESTSGNGGTRVASIPTTPEFNLGTVESKSSTPAAEVPVLPPLLSDSKPRDSSVNIPTTPTTGSIQPSVVSFGTPVGDSSNIDLDRSKLEKPEIPSTAPMLDLSQFKGESGIIETNPVSSTVSNQQPNSTAQNVHVVETLTPERSLAEFEWLFRNATQNPLVPYRSVSAGGHENSLGQPIVHGAPTSPLTGFGSATGANQKTTADGPTAYQPLTIPMAEAVPAYEKNVPGQPVNRYQPRIKQPQKSLPPETINVEALTTPAPYQPLVVPDAPQSGVTGTSYGYPPVQYSPATKTTTENSSVQNIPGQR